MVRRSHDHRSGQTRSTETRQLDLGEFDVGDITQSTSTTYMSIPRLAKSCMVATDHPAAVTPSTVVDSGKQLKQRSSGRQS